MDAINIVLIVLGCVVGLVVLILTIGKISAGKKKINIFSSKRKAAKAAKVAPIIKQEQKPAAEELPENMTFSKSLQKKATVVDYDGLDENDKRALCEQPQPPKEPEPERPRRRSIEELIRNRETVRQQDIIPVVDDDDRIFDDDFDSFQAQHSVYSKYIADQTLIDRIKDLDPQTRALILSSIFDRRDDE